jgi:hypothetical protein
MTGDDSGHSGGDTEWLRRQIMSYAREQKNKASDDYHAEESGSFEQGIKLGKRHAMSDLMEFVRSIETDTDRSGGGE